MAHTAQDIHIWFSVIEGFLASKLGVDTTLSADELVEIRQVALSASRILESIATDLHRIADAQEVLSYNDSIRLQRGL